MNSNAPGQFLGYALQIPRAFYHLLKAGPGDIVCVEVLGDVATLTSDGRLITEEDKSSVGSNPITDKSTNLWKTFANWISGLNSGEIQIDKTVFIIFTNKSGRSGIVDAFHSAKTKDEAKVAIADAKRLLDGIGDSHDIWEYYNLVANLNKSLLEEVVLRFELQVGTDAGFDEVRQELIRMVVPTNQISFLQHSITGWITREITENIAKKKPGRLMRDDFHKQFMVVFDRIRRRELIDFASREPAGDDAVQQQVRIKPCYLKQLLAIECDEEELIGAVTDFMKAKVNRDKWIDFGIIDDDTVIDFQEKMLGFWRNQNKRLELTNKTLADKERGRLLLLDCKSRRETIRGESPPPSTIPGTYHALADEPLLGWHPKWEILFTNPKDERHE